MDEMRRWIAALGFAAVLVGTYTAWPFLGLYRLGSALHSTDVEDALHRIDIPAIRRSIVAQVVDEIGRDDRVDAELDRLGDFGRNIAMRAAAAQMDRRFETVLTPAVLRELVVRGTLPAGFHGEASGVRVPGGYRENVDGAGVPENPLRLVQDWGFESVRRFGVLLGDRDMPRDWIGVTVRLEAWTWKLVAVRLPESVLERVQPVIRQEMEALQS